MNHHAHRATRALPSALALACGLALTGPLFAQTTGAEPASAPSSSTSRLGQREDDRRPEQPFTVQIGPLPFELTGNWEANSEQRRNFDTDNTRARNRRVREHEVKLEARTRRAPAAEVLLQVKGTHETRRTQGTAGKQVTHALERGQTWVRFAELGGSPWSIQVGRVAMAERRSWWWDDDLDAVRAQYTGTSFLLDMAVARELGRRSSAEDSLPGEARGVTRRMVQGSWLPTRRHRVDGFLYDERDRSGTPAVGSVVDTEERTDTVDRKARWFGARAIGEWRFDPVARLAYWADGATVRGHEQSTDYTEGNDGRFTAGATERTRLRGNAWDAGLSLSAPEWPLRPFVTASQARGSKGFRQTGLHENKSRRGGVKRWLTYGELLQPELSNLKVQTVGGGIRMFERSSLEVYGHRYRQLEASSTLRGSRLSSDPQGTNTHIGKGVDVLLALREWRRFEVFARWSSFTPGAAFDSGERDRATAVEIGAQLNF